MPDHDGPVVADLEGRVEVVRDSNQSSKCMEAYYAREEGLQALAQNLQEQQRRAKNMSFHEATVCVTFDGLGSPRKIALFNLGGLLLVLVQLSVGIEVAKGSSSGVCTQNRHCIGARVCVPTGPDVFRSEHRQSSSCVNCGDGPAVGATSGYRNQTRSGDSFECPANDGVCAACFIRATGSFSNYTYKDEVVDNVAAMRFKDWLAMVISSLVLGLQLSCEMENSVRCEIFRKQFRSRENNSRQPFHALLWLRVQQLTVILRRWALLPCVVSGAYTLIAYRGGDALNICLNTVALTFLINCDDLLYKHAVSDAERAATFRSMLALGRAKADNDGLEADKVYLQGHAKADDDEFLVAWVKLATVVVVPVSMTVGLALSLQGKELFFEHFDGGHLVSLLTLTAPLAESQVRGRVSESGRFFSMMRHVGQCMLGGAVAICLAYLL